MIGDEDKVRYKQACDSNILFVLAFNLLLVLSCLGLESVIGYQQLFSLG